MPEHSKNTADYEAQIQTKRRKILDGMLTFHGLLTAEIAAGLNASADAVGRWAAGARIPVYTEALLAARAHLLAGRTCAHARERVAWTQGEFQAARRDFILRLQECGEVTETALARELDAAPTVVAKWFNGGLVSLTVGSLRTAARACELRSKEDKETEYDTLLKLAHGNSKVDLAAAFAQPREVCYLDSKKGVCKFVSLCDRPIPEGTLVGVTAGHNHYDGCTCREPQPQSAAYLAVAKIIPKLTADERASLVNELLGV